MITHKEAVELMYSFVRKNISGLDKLREEENSFVGKKDGIDVILRVAEKAIRPSQSFVSYIKGDASKDIATAVLILRSATKYKGKLLKKLGEEIGGTKHWKNRKKFSQFEQDILKLYGNKSAYYNPQENRIEIISTKRFRKIPEFLASKTPEELAKNTVIRKSLHREESKREYDRKIWFSEIVKGPFTLEIYQRKTKPLVARIVPYCVR